MTTAAQNDIESVSKELSLIFGLNAVESSKLTYSFTKQNNFYKWQRIMFPPSKTKNNPFKTKKTQKKIYDFLNEKIGTGLTEYHPDLIEPDRPYERQKTHAEHFKEGLTIGGTIKKDPYVDKITRQFLTDISNSEAPWMKPWKANEYVIPRNGVTNSFYNGINSLYLETLQLNLFKSDDPRWLTYLQIKDQNYHLKKGSLSYPIAYHNNIKLDENGKITNDPDKTVKTRRIRKMYAVFHASQIERLPAYENNPETLTDTNEIFKQAELLIKSSGAQLFHNSYGKNFYNDKTDVIHLTAKHTFSNPSDYYKTAFHELAHWTGHSSRLNRDFYKNENEKAREELRAEITAYRLCKKLNIDYNPNNSISYIKNWSKLLMESENEILKAYQDTDKIIKFIEHPNSNRKTARLENKEKINRGIKR